MRMAGSSAPPSCRRSSSRSTWTDPPSRACGGMTSTWSTWSRCRRAPARSRAGSDRMKLPRTRALGPTTAAEVDRLRHGLRALAVADVKAHALRNDVVIATHTGGGARWAPAHRSARSTTGRRSRFATSTTRSWM